jgi:hypothetical protein
MLNLELFGTLPKFLYRKDAPETSIQSAHAVDTKSLEKIVYEVIRSHPDGCISDDVIGELDNFSYPSITARYKALMTKKLVCDTGEKRPGKSGKLQRVMKACCHNSEPQ